MSTTETQSDKIEVYENISDNVRKFNNKEEFTNFANMLLNRSQYTFETTVSKEDIILTLSTCANDNNYRVVLHARKIK